jgi:hypothetical protein
MNPLIKKEIRLLLPAWFVAMLLAIFPAWLWHLSWVANARPEKWDSYAAMLASDIPLAFALGTLFLGLASFGQEISSGAFSILLSQPAERLRLWRVKITTLAAAFVSVWLVAAIFVSWQLSALNDVMHPPSDLFTTQSDTFGSLTVYALAACTGGLWTTLLLRQITGALWVTLLVPVSVVFGMGTILDHWMITDEALNTIIVVVLFAYSLAGFLWARRLFFNAQDIQWTGGHVLFPWRKSVSQAGSFASPRFRHPLALLVWKEIRLHEVNLFLAAALLAVHLAALFLRDRISNQNLKMGLEFFWSLWLLLPLFIGSAAVAEERKLGVIESQLCLPIVRRYQFSIKFFVAFVLSVFFGAVMPSVVENTANFGVHSFNFWIFIAASALFFISFYASTLARSMLQAIGLAIALPVVAGTGIYLAFSWTFRGDYYDSVDAGLVLLMLFVGIPVLLLVLIGLMLWNFKWLHENKKIWWHNIVTVLISLIFVGLACSLVFFRSWEWFTPLESPHGAAHPDMAGINFSIAPGTDAIISTRPDGKLWEEKLGFVDVNDGSFFVDHPAHFFPRLKTQQLNGDFDWLKTSASYFFILGIKTNGSLWAAPRYEPMTQMGSDTDWLRVARSGNSFLLLKKGGTLWVWGTNEVSEGGSQVSRLSGKIKSCLATPPTRISDETNWTDIISFSHLELVQKNDGSLWNWQSGWEGTNYFYHLVQETNMENQWLAYVYGGEWSAGIKTNGELWILTQPPAKWGWDSSFPAYAQKIKIPSDAVWKGLDIFQYDSLILLRSDGTLWKWKFIKSWKQNDYPYGWGIELSPFDPIQLGHQSDWVALEQGSWWSGTAMSADGSIWAWDDPSDRMWLAPSRKPVYLGNIFQGSAAPNSIYR